jgi:ectoine hydroxylase-related dioxygenase (phytanoyl-CoA dioxygenase family)
MNDFTIKDIFKEQGYYVFKGALSPKEVQELVDATDKALTAPGNTNDLLTINKTQHVHKILYMFEKGDVFLKTLVHPSFLQVVSALCETPEQIVPTWEDMLIKVPYEGVPVTVHQDLALQSVHHEVFSLGVYLHSSRPNPVYYLPKSHKLGPLTKEEIYKVYEEQKDAFVPVYADPGDIIVHNVKTVHYSEANNSSSPRYTWYLEFRTLDQLRTDSPWDEDWILARRAIWVSALKQYAPNMRYWIQDEKALEAYLNPLNLRVSHTNEHITYDQANPYNHF